MADPIEALETRRAQLLAQLAETGDMRQGCVTENYRCCGKTGCACSVSEHPGHGPYYAFTRKVDGKTKTVNLRPGPSLDKLEREVGTYRRFRQECQQLLEVNEQICDARPVDAMVLDPEKVSLKKKLWKPSRKKSRRK